MRAVALFLLAVSAVVNAGPLSKRAPVLPTQDSFYTPPAGLSASKPGDVLRTRTIQPSLNNMFPLFGAVKAYQLGYRTTDVGGGAAYTVTTVFIPAKPIANALVGYSAAEDSSFLNCAPSYNFQLGATDTNENVGEETPFIAGLLLAGYTVTSSDYEGLNSTFSSGRTSGMGTLDALRATLNAGNLTGIDKSQARVANVGYSGGAISTGWAAALQPSYAPELSSKLVGFALGGIPADLAKVLSYLDSGVGGLALFSGFGLAGVSGLLYDYPKLMARFNEIATPAGKAAVAYARSHCADDDLSFFGGKKIESTTYQSDGTALLQDPVVKSILDTLVLGSDSYASETPQVPTLAYHCVTDEVIPIGQVDDAIAGWCRHSPKSIVYQRDISVACDHVSEAVKGFPAVLAFLADRFAGKAATPGCTKQDVAIPTPDLLALGASGVPIVQRLLSLATSGKVF